MNTCALCENPIDSVTDSREHIIPQAIGGRKKVRGFICRSCNNRRGCDWDSAIAAQLNWFSVALNVSRENGAPRKERVEGPDGSKLWLHSDSSMTLDEPVVTVDDTESGRRFRLRPRTIVEARKKLEEIRRKYPQVDVEKELSNAVINSTRPGVIKTSFQFGGELAGRSLVKTAVAMAYEMGIDPRTCDFAMSYLKTEGGTPALAEFYLRDLVCNRPSDSLINSVTICADQERKRLYGYIEYFGVVRYVIHLSQRYSGPPAHSTYAVNVATGVPAELSVKLDLSDEEFALSLANETGDLGQFKQAFDYAMPIVLRSLYAREDERALNGAIALSLKELGVDSDAEVPAEKQRQFNRLVAEKLSLHFINVVQLRPRL